MAVEPAVQRRGIGSAVMAELIRRLEATDAVLLWASARDSAVPFYERSGFRVVEGSGSTPRQTGRPHHLIELSLRAQRR
jgi:ribosomal protein S18 acetylase RimI-like enzyme